MQHEEYTLQYFLDSESFHAYALGTDLIQADRWAHWMAQHPEQAVLAEQAAELLRTMAAARIPSADETAKRADWNRLQARIDRQAPPAGRYWQARHWAAAALVLVLGLGTFWVATTYLARTEIRTTYGETRRITLPDSSEVVLNANSLLSFQNDWNTGQPREVRLEGEAFFSVRKMQRLASRGTASGREPVKFTVVTPKLNVEVLGTRFTVSYRGDRTLVTLNEGSIKLNVPELNTAQEKPKPVLMKPGEQIEYARESRTLRRKTVRPEMVSSWTRQAWQLDQVPLSEVAANIRDIYGVEVQVADTALAREQMNGILPMHDLPSLLKDLSIIYQLKVKKEGEKIILYR